MKELTKRLKEYRYPALILALGLILMLLPGREKTGKPALSYSADMPRWKSPSAAVRR